MTTIAGAVLVAEGVADDVEVEVITGATFGLTKSEIALGPPQISPALPAHGMLQDCDATLKLPPLTSEEPQKHWLEYSRPAMVNPWEAHMLRQISKVMLV